TYVQSSFLCHVAYISVFFFQAEDGIRDFHVTGVQTCALPISGKPWCATPVPASSRSTTTRSRTRSARSPSARRTGCLPARNVPRSEERRVGKEGRSRWSACHRIE